MAADAIGDDGFIVRIYHLHNRDENLCNGVFSPVVWPIHISLINPNIAVRRRH